MAAEEIKVGDWGALKFVLIVVLAVLIGSVLVKWGGEAVHEMRRQAYIKANPNAAVQVAPVAQVPAVTQSTDPAAAGTGYP